MLGNPLYACENDCANEKADRGIGATVSVSLPRHQQSQQQRPPARYGQYVAKNGPQ